MSQWTKLLKRQFLLLGHKWVTWTEQPIHTFLLWAHLFSSEGDFLQVVCLEDVLGLSPACAGAPHAPLPHHAQGQVAEGSQVPTGSHSTLQGDVRQAGRWKGVGQGRTK